MERRRVQRVVQTTWRRRRRRCCSDARTGVARWHDDAARAARSVVSVPAHAVRVACVACRVPNRRARRSHYAHVAEGGLAAARHRVRVRREARRAPASEPAPRLRRGRWPPRGAAPHSGTCLAGCRYLGEKKRDPVDKSGRPLWDPLNLLRAQRTNPPGTQGDFCLVRRTVPTQMQNVGVFARGFEQHHPADGVVLARQLHAVHRAA